MRIGLERRQTWEYDRVTETLDSAYSAYSATTARIAWQQLSGALAALAVLTVLLPGPGRCLAVLDGRMTGFAPGAGASSAAETAMLLVSALVVWTLLLWGSAVALVALAARLPGRVGRGGRATLARIAPGVARKLVLTAVGASMVTGLAAGGTGPAAAAPVPASASASADHQHVDGPHDHTHIWSGDGRSTHVPVGRPGIPAVSWTSVEGSAVQLRSDLRDTSAGSEAGPTGQLNIDWPVLPARVGSGAPRNPVDIDWPNPPAPVVVLAGDSLWSIAAHGLPAGAGDAQIQKATRDWYAANVSVIGNDPNLILPGQILQPPNQETTH